jgi:anti-sigma regulatory factor (Ser/Thr protein kinase)
MPATAEFRHEALLYPGPGAFLDRVAPFVEDAVAAEQPIMVALAADKLRGLRDRLGAGADQVIFADMGELGRNPARIIPAWREFVDAHEGRSIRGVGEPIWPERTGAELVECQCHEALLNAAFDGDGDFHLVCPYDTEELHPAVIDEAQRSHPIVSARESRGYRGPEAPQLGELLPEPAWPPAEHPVTAATLPGLRSLVAAYAETAGLPGPRVNDLVLAVHEAASNTVRHGGGIGTLRIWDDAEGVICELCDSGRIDEPLAGRVRPRLAANNGWGLWLTNQLCDLVQIRTLPDGGVVRLHMHRS